MTPDQLKAQIFGIARAQAEPLCQRCGHPIPSGDYRVEDDGQVYDTFCYETLIQKARTDEGEEVSP